MNFYVFPDRGADVVMSPGAIDFLRKNGLDFGKWIGKGLPFAGMWSKNLMLIIQLLTFKGENNVSWIQIARRKNGFIIVTSAKKVRRSRNARFHFLELET